MSESNRVRLAYKEQAGLGTPATGNYQVFRRTGGGFKETTDSKKSREVRSDAQVAAIIRTAKKGDGTLDFELSYATPDDFLEGALRSDWSTPLAISAATIAFDATAGTIADSANGLGAVVPGQIIGVTGAVAPGNNNDFLITTVAAGLLTVDPDWKSTMVTAVAGPTVHIKGMYLRNATTAKYYTVETTFQDLSNVFVVANDQRVDTFTLKLQAQNIIEGTFGFMGKDAVPQASAAASGYVNANTNEVLNMGDHFDKVHEGGGLSALDITDVELDWKNTLRQLPKAGSINPVDTKAGQAMLEGKFKAYFADLTMVQKASNWTTSSLYFRTKDTAGNRYWWCVPSLKFKGSIDPGQLDSDIYADLAFEAFMDAVYGYTFQVCAIAP